METLELVAMEIFNNKDNMTSAVYLELMDNLKDFYNIINENPLMFEDDDKIQVGDTDSDEDLDQDLSYSNYYQDNDDGYLSDYIESY